jgi:EF-hand domain-containing protein 1
MLPNCFLEMWLVGEICWFSCGTMLIVALSLQYYLADDTMQLLEVHSENDGYDPFPVFMIRHRCPKDRNDVARDFPLSVMEITDEEVKEYFSPVDFAIGRTILIYGRRFLIYDIDNFTKAFYWKNFGMTDFTPVDVDVKKPELPKAVS